MSKQNESNPDTKSSGEEAYNKTSVDSVDELSVGDGIDIFYQGGYEHATVTDTDLPGRTPAVELSSGADKLRIKEFSQDNQQLVEWRQGIEEDFADWRPKGTVNNIELVEKEPSETNNGATDQETRRDVNVE